MIIYLGASWYNVIMEKKFFIFVLFVSWSVEAKKLFFFLKITDLL